MFHGGVKNEVKISGSNVNWVLENESCESNHKSGDNFKFEYEQEENIMEVMVMIRYTFGHSDDNR